MNRPLIYIASPYGAKSAEGIQENIDFVKAAGRAAVEAGYTPVIVHLVYPVLLRDDVPEERALGISMDFQLLEKCDAMVYYTHKGVSPGMDLEIRHALEPHLPSGGHRQGPATNHRPGRVRGPPGGRQGRRCRQEARRGTGRGSRREGDHRR